MKKRFLSAMALLLGANVTWADPVPTNVPATGPKMPVAPTTPASGPKLPSPPTMPASGPKLPVAPSTPVSSVKTPVAPGAPVGSVNTPVAPGTPVAGSKAPVAPAMPAAGKPATTVAAPRSLVLPEAQNLPKPSQAPAAGQTPPAAPPAGTPPPAPGTAAPAPVQPAAMAPAQNGGNGARRPAVDLRDCHIGPEGCYWASAEYLLWWVKRGPLPVALVTTTPTPGPGSFGAIGQPGTTVLIGNESLSYGTLSGARFEAGAWLNQRHTLGVDAAFFFLEQGQANQFVASSAAGSPLLARPFFNVVTNAQSAFLVSVPGSLQGSVAVGSESQIWGIESNLVRNVYYTECFRADLLFGFRNLNLEENLSIAQTTSIVPGGAGALIFNNVAGTAAGDTIIVNDRFGTVNHFYGGQIGGRFQVYRGCWVFDVMTKVALGVNHEAVNILGQTTAAFAGAGSGTLTSGLLAINNSNYGTRINDTTNYFAVAPEVKLGVGYQLSRHLRAQMGWNFLYLSGVARPGNHIDTSVNPTLVPTSASFAPTAPTQPPTGIFAPNLSIRQTDFWAQGVNFSLLFTY